MNKITKDLREKNVEALQEDLKKARRDLFDLRTSVVTQKIEDTSKFGKTRKQIARIQTIIKQKQSAANA